MISVHYIHHDADLYPKPERFDPSRLDPEELKSRHLFSYLPFRDGPWSSIVLRIGKMQIMVGLVSLLCSFKFDISKITEIP